MKKLLLTICLVVFSVNLQAKEWYEEKGTLHTSTMGQWCKADNKDKLITVADFIARGYQEKLFKDEIQDALDKSGIDGFKMLAQEVVKGLDRSSCKGKKVIPEMKNTKVSDNSALIITLMGLGK